MNTNPKVDSSEWYIPMSNNIVSDLKDDIKEVKTELKGDIKELSSDISELRTELKGDIAMLSRVVGAAERLNLMKTSDAHYVGWS